MLLIMNSLLENAQNMIYSIELLAGTFPDNHSHKHCSGYIKKGGRQASAIFISPVDYGSMNHLRMA